MCHELQVQSRENCLCLQVSSPPSDTEHVIPPSPLWLNEGQVAKLR